MLDRSPLQPLDESWERALAVVAHPDDIEYGPVSAVARWVSQGKQVSYYVVTRGEAGISTMTPAEAGPLREQEEYASADVVGVRSVEFGDYPDGTIEYGLQLRRDIARVIRRHQPHLVIANSPHLIFGPGFLNSADHRAVGLASLDAVQDAANRWIFPELLAEGLEPWSGVQMTGFGPSARMTHAVDVTDFFQQGMDSLRKHAAYLAALGTGDPEPIFRMLAEITGSRLGCKLAIGFEIVYGPGIPPDTFRADLEEARAAATSVDPGESEGDSTG